MGSLSSVIQEILYKKWGYKSFRPLQKEIILSILDGKDTIGLLPTGGGKSITFQVPGLFYDDGLTIVVTPLISLMKDQVDNLKKRRIKAVALYSGMSAKENRLAWEHLTHGNARFLYISPERINSQSFIAELRNLKVNFITVDEAHCISQWGYDFRPSYLNIKKLRALLPSAPVLALTATATPEVVEDIKKQLCFKDNNVYINSFSRDNLSYIVRKADTKISSVLHILSKTQGSSIVYVRSRKKSKEIAEYLSSSGISATFYHAGLINETKTERQNEWKSGKIRVMVATNAFGMGIDKPDVRVVIHYDLPPSLEEYYQEAGRAGRDGLPSFAVLLTDKTDKGILNRRITEAFPDRKIIKKTYEQICTFLHFSVGEGYEAVKEFDITKFCTLFHRQEKECRNSLRLLGQAGYMEFFEEAEKRSRLTILLRREDLYDVDFKNPVTEAVLASILRLYTGLFSEYIYIREEEIAARLKINVNEVYNALLELDKRKIADYIPRNGLPLIYMPTSREETHTLLIGTSIYEERKKIMERRVDAIQNYAFRDSSCRVKRMLSYFGEKDAKDCGKCDVCRDKKKKSDNIIDLPDRILEFLKMHPEGVRFISLENFCKSDTKLLSENLAYLCSEGHIRLENNLYFLN